MKIGKVYKLVNNVNDLFYIGSTRQKLCRRMTDHRKEAKNGKTSPLYRAMKETGVKHWKIILIKKIRTDDKEELLKLENKYICKFKEKKNCLNCNRAYRSDEYKKEYDKLRNKKYRELNEEVIRMQRRVTVECDVCGIKITKKNMPRHERSQKHQKTLSKI